MKPVTQALLPLLTRTATRFDYADQRYYMPGSGRFMTADPYQASAGPSDPGSWNRYAYVQGDPVNYTDSTGQMIDQLADGGGGGWGVLSILSFGLFGRGLPANYFDLLSDREVWRRNPEKPVAEWDMKIAAAIADAARQRSTDDLQVLYPHHLKVVDDCYDFYVGSVKRVRTYEVQDQNGNAFQGSVLVQEYNHVAYGALDPKASNQKWGTTRFEDYLARGYGEDILQYQQFTITYTVTGVPVTSPIAVMERNGQMYGTQGIKMMQDKVMMNRDDGTGIRRCR